jgi:hypothetical protein
MKSGASDPFADDDGTADTAAADTTAESADTESETDADAEPTAAEAPATESSPPAADADDSPADASQPSTTDTAADQPAESTDDAVTSRDELPFVLRRDKVKDERPEVHQLFVQRSTHDRAVEAERTLENRLGVDLSRTDAREAIYLAGMAQLDDAEAILREWGYDF